MGRTDRRFARVTAVAGLVLVAASCGSEDARSGDRDSDEPEPVGEAEPVGDSSESSPFRVGRPPDDYWLAGAGRGSTGQTWSSDSFGDDEPVTVLAPEGQGPGGPDEVRVSLTGFEGYQGELAQASRGYGNDKQQQFELDGQRAIYMPPRVSDSGEAKPADLVVVAGEDLAVRVSSRDGTRDELAAVAREVRPQDDHLFAPPVPDPPGDLKVLGWADADVAISLVGRPVPPGAHLPAGERAHTAFWVRGEEPGAWDNQTETVQVTTLPGRALSLAATEASLHYAGWIETLEVAETEVDGRPAVVLDAPGDTPIRAVVTSTPGGDLLLVTAYGDQRPAADALVAVAASVEETGPAEWEDLVREATGGPGLHPDPGAVELERGAAGDIEWLFQALIDDGSTRQGASSGDEDTTGQYVADRCLKLSTDERLCSHSEYGTGDGYLLIQSSGPGPKGDENIELPGFVMVTTTAEATTTRFHTADGEVLDATLHALPGGERRAGVVVVAAGTEAFPDLFLPNCIEPGDPAEPGGIELLDESGQRLPCR